MDEYDKEIQRITDDAPISAREALVRMDAQMASGEPGSVVGTLEGAEARKLMEALFAADGEEIPEDVRRFFE